MDPETLKQPLKYIREKLSEIESGKFKYTIPIREQNIEIAALLILINIESQLLQTLESILYVPEEGKQSSPTFPPTGSTTPLNRDQLLAEQATTYIKSHLRERLPSTRKFAIMLGTNEKILKRSFFKMHGMGLHQFHTKLRLEELHELIAEQAEKSLKEIVLGYGFENYHSFYCAFKRQFNYAPQSVREPKNK